MDTKPKHTPGPWSIGAEATCLMATDEKGGRFHAIDGANHGALAVVVTKLAQDYPDGSSCERLMANARLITAAPDLLAALEEARTGLQWYHDTYPEAVNDCDHEAMERIGGAILLATGSAS